MLPSQSQFLGAACADCLKEQAARLLSRLILDPTQQKDLLNEIVHMLEQAFIDGDNLIIHRDIYAKIYEAAGDPDPFLELKKKSTNDVLALYPTLKKQIEESQDPLELAVRFAIAGNVIDFAIPHPTDLMHALSRSLEQPLAINHLGHLRSRLAQAEHLLYLGDNAGETVMDRILIEAIGLPTVYVVRGAPVINDALEIDAVEAGIDTVARVLSSGSAHAGTVLPDCDPELQELFAEAPVVISKGQGNFESLIHETREIFFLLKVKCDLVADHLNAHVGDSVLLAANVRNST